MIEKPRVFVTDGSYPNSLAAVRALSRAGYRVTVGEREGVKSLRTIGFWSRCCSQTLRYPDPRSDSRACAAALSEHLQSGEYKVTIPVGLDMVELFVTYREILSERSMLPGSAAFNIASDKRLTFKHARDIGIPIPHTLEASRWHELEPPIVFKHPRTGALIAHTRQAATAEAERLGPHFQNYMAQEYIPGENGFGYFGFFQNGRETGHFLHERLMQFPKQGGPSVVARAIRCSRIWELGRTLLESLNWHGPAMVEFKRSSRDGQFYLMEINPKLWGSLDLAIQAGCNFPVWIAQAVINGTAPDCSGYREGLNYQWVIPNGLKSFLKYPEFRMPFLRNLLAPGVRTDLRWLDPLPAAAGLITMAANLVRK
jgi:predicted ATP-grasp superfamily ATP-dependent carboligase